MWSAKPGVTLTREQRQTVDALMPIVHIRPKHADAEVPVVVPPDIGRLLIKPFDTWTPDDHATWLAYRTKGDAQSARERPQIFQRTGAGDQAS